jgi:hypothetical protein
MKVNHRLVAAVAIVGCLSVSLVGCGSGGGEPQAEAKVADTKGVATKAEEGETKAEAKGGEGKEAQCQKITTLLSSGRSEMTEAQSGAASDKVGAMKKMAEITGKYADQFKALELQDEKLQGFQERFVALNQSVSEAAAGAVEANEKQDAEAGKAAVAAIQEAASGENALLSEVQQYCGG